ncbi:glutaredoxin family protein [Deinococcus arcticus]|uniref:NrdH-redoxin n=1 Tax=Deinococcus arcticus TaxID=2136176 RepID=A0A2T3W4H0_9DEIO|nr:glutaredoxin family protein [Deinococcus arcticus]PTA66777.1 NrdH-redoxin [Deinococcus arcticus]
MPEITLYTTADCAESRAVQRLLGRCGAPFRIRNLQEDAGALAELRNLTETRITPVTVIGTQVFAGPVDQQRPGLLAALQAGA